MRHSIFNKAIAAIMVLTLVICINRPALAYPTSDVWYFVHNNYATNSTKVMQLNKYLNGYYAIMDSKSGNDPGNGVEIQCTNAIMTNAYLNTVNSEIPLSPSSISGLQYVEFKVSLTYNYNYWSQNSGRIRQGNVD